MHERYRCLVGRIQRCTRQASAQRSWPCLASLPTRITRIVNPPACCIAACSSRCSPQVPFLDLG